MSDPIPSSTLEQTIDTTTAEVSGKMWSAGTLRYTKGGILMLFFWLAWNDFCFMLMEQVPSLTPILMKDHGASNKEIAFYMSTLCGVFTLWINPFISTWSDRHRSPFGRRRPFLFFAAPFCALFLAAIPFAPRLAPILGIGGSSAVIMLIGIAFICFAIFNSVMQSLFSYYFYDVVPVSLLGRFGSVTKIVTTLATFLWNYWFFGLAAKHMEAVYVGIAGFFLVIYMATLWRVKEGEYPPPDERKRSWFGPIRAYFVECYSQPYYRWIFAASVIYQIGNMSNMYQVFYFRDTLGMSLDTIGKMRSWPSLLIVLLAYPAGALVDRRNPMRVIPPALFVWAGINVGCFFFLRGPISLLICLGLITLIVFVFQVGMGILPVKVFPREKLGQFCSANSVSSAVVGFIIAVPLGMLFDHLKDYRYVFIWSATFEVLAGFMYIKVYRNWKRVGEQAPLVQSHNG